MGRISLQDKGSMRVFFLDLWDFVQHVSVYNCNSDIILPIADIVLQIHGVRVGLDQDVVLANCLIHLLSLAAVDDQDYQISRQPLLYLLYFVVTEEVLGSDVGMHVQFRNVVQVCSLPVLTLSLPFIRLSNGRPLSFRILINLQKEVHLLIGQLLNRLIFLIRLFLF